MNNKTFSRASVGVRCVSTLAAAARMLALVALACLVTAGVCRDREDPGPIPENVSNNAGCSEDASMAVDSRGTVHLAWTDNTPGLEQGDRSNQEILYACKPQGETWSSPINVSHNIGASRFPCLAVDLENRLHAVWQDCSPAGDWSIFYVSKPRGGEWSVPETISGYGGCLEPWIAVDSTLNVHLVWLTGWYDLQIWYASRNRATGWSTPVPILPKPSNVWTQPKIACDERGGIHAAWSGSDTLHAPVYVYYSNKPPGGAWQPWQPISTTGHVTTSEVAFAFDHDNNAHFVWIDHYKEHGCIAYRERFADGTWSEVMACSTITGMLPSWPLGLAVGPDDCVHLVWRDYLEESSGSALCYSSRLGPTWEDRRTLAECVAHYPAVGVGPRGEVHAAYDVYMDVASGNTDICYLQVK
jgi:hypothetical protein